MAVSFTGRGNWSSRRKPPICRKSLTHWWRYEFTTLVVVGTDCIDSYISIRSYDHDHDIIQGSYCRLYFVHGNTVLVKTKFVFYDFLKIDCYLMSSKQYFSYVHSENKHTVNYVGKKVADGRTCGQKRRLTQNTAHIMISSENVLIVPPDHLRSL